MAIKFNPFTGNLQKTNPVIPAQSTNAGKYLQTDGTKLVWAPMGVDGGNATSTYT